MNQRSKCLKILGQILIPHSFVSKVGGGYFGIRAASNVQEACESSKCRDELGGIDWDNVGFNFKQTDYMYVNKRGKDEDEFTEGQICRFGNIELTPFAGILNYGQVSSFISNSIFIPSIF
ncbi:hypothetical protein ACS0TY_025950 [Phlomoides rotata]